MSTVTRHTPGTPCWFDLSTNDGPASRNFYAQLLGWEIDEPDPSFGNYVSARVGVKKAAGIGEIPPGQSMPTGWSIYFMSEDADKTAEGITAAGGTVIMPPMEIGPHGRMMMALDPTGASFGVWQPGAHSGAEIVGEPGAMAWCECNTPDADNACAFYAKVFGLTAKKLDAPMPTAYFTLHPTADANGVCGVLQMNEQWAGVPPHWMVYFAVQNIDLSVNKIAELGGKVSVPPFDTPYGRMGVMSDSQGSVFSLIQLPENMPAA